MGQEQAQNDRNMSPRTKEQQDDNGPSVGYMTHLEVNRQAEWGASCSNGMPGELLEKEDVATL